MSAKDPAINSVYTIDGVRQGLTPAQLLDPLTENCVGSGLPEDAVPDIIVDESADTEVKNIDVEEISVHDCMKALSGCRRRFPLSCADFYTRLSIASALIDALWKKGHFRLGDLLLEASWRWNETPVGAMAAFYTSVQAAADYVDALNLRFSGWQYSRSGLLPSAVKFRAVTTGEELSEEESAIVEPFRTEHPIMDGRRICPAALVPDPRSWLVYIPFDPSEYSLGGSLLAQELGLGGAAPAIDDADYFIDCYEVVREFAEDGVLLSAATVGAGGLMAALQAMTRRGPGIRADISDVMHTAYGKCLQQVLFSEVPGVLIQVRDADFDYIDAELLLQDVLYFPLGHPDAALKGVDVEISAKNKIQTILDSLMQNAEGED